VNVSKLSDQELNRAIFWLHMPEDDWVVDDGVYLNSNICMDEIINYRYTDDWSLTGPLMIKYKIQLTPMAFSPEAWNAYACVELMSYNQGAYNPLRAICECVLIIRMAK